MHHVQIQIELSKLFTFISCRCYLRVSFRPNRFGAENFVYSQHKLNCNERELVISSRIFETMAISETDVIIELSPNDFQSIIHVTK